MIITYHGKEFFKMQQGDFVVAWNPISKDSSWKGKLTKFGADLVFQTINHPDYNGIDQVTYGDKLPHVISGAGEYEIKGVFVHGTSIPVTLGKHTYINTMYTAEFESMTVCFLGVLTEMPSAEARGPHGNPDMLFISISEEGGLTPAQAYKLAVSLEPKVIIPMDYSEKTLAQFLKEAGNEKAERMDKFTVKKKDIEQKVAEVIVLAVS